MINFHIGIIFLPFTDSPSIIGEEIDAGEIIFFSSIYFLP